MAMLRKFEVITNIRAQFKYKPYYFLKRRDFRIKQNHLLQHIAACLPAICQ